MAIWAIFVSMMTLASFLKVQRYGFFAAEKPTLSKVRGAPALMALAMICLAVLCVAMAFLVVSGFEAPLIVRPAADALLSGVFSIGAG